MSASRTPGKLGRDGKRLWVAISAAFELEAHELLMLEQACRTADVCATLSAAVDGYEGQLVTSGGRIVPELVELRLERVALARLLIALRVPLAGSDAVPQYRGLRGMYGGVA